MISRRALDRLMLAMIGCMALLTPVRAEQRSQDFSRDPGWEGHLNRIKAKSPPHKHQDFGWSPADHCGRGAGEIGGTVWRSARPAYYAKVLDPPLTFDSPIHTSGTLALTDANATSGWRSSSTFIFGFFNHEHMGMRPPNAIGVLLEGYNEPDGALAQVFYGTSRWEADAGFVNQAGGLQQRLTRNLDHTQLLRIPEDGSPHAWSLDYDPAGNGGNGLITFVLDGYPTLLPVREDHRKSGARLDRFGIMNCQAPGMPMTAWIDGLMLNGERLDFAADPKWEAVDNRLEFDDANDYGMNNFGYSPTAHAGGKPGEIGGWIWRVQEPEYSGWYGDRIGRLTLDNKLEAGGKLAIPNFGTDSGLIFGWFNESGQGWPPRNFVGVYMDSLGDFGRFFTPMYGTSRARSVPRGEKTDDNAGSGEVELAVIPDGRVYDWKIVYDPAAAGGRGAVTVELNGQRQTIALSPGHREQGAEFTHFGIVTMQHGNGRATEIYLDDLTYTAKVIP